MKIVDRVNAEGTRARRLVLFSACAAGIAGGAALLTLGAFVLGGGRWLSLPSWIPFAWWAVATGLIAFAAWRLPRRVSATVTDEALARATERERGLRAGSLVGLVQLSSMGGSLVQLQEHYVGGLLGTGALAPEHGKKHAFAALGAAATVVVAGVITWVSTASGSDGWRALMHPVAAANGSLLPPLSLVNTPISVLRGDSLVARVQATGRRHVTLSWRETGSGWRDSVLTVTDGEAMLPLGSIDAPLVIVADDGRSSSDSLDVKVFERPFAGDVALRAVYPSYLGRAAEVLGADDLLRLPEGTSIEITARSAGLSKVALAGERDTIPLQLLAGRAVGRMTASASGSWKWISTTQGADLPPSIEFDVIPDSAPRIEIISPTHDTLVTPGDSVRLLVAATDDHGLNSARLRMWTERGRGTKEPERLTSLAQVGGPRWIGELELDLAVSDLKPGDALMIVAEARDAAPWGRFGESKRLELRVPTADEKRAAAMSAADSAVARATAAAAEQKGLEKRTSEASKNGAKSDESKGSSKDGNAASFEQQEKARELVADQKALAERMQEMSKQADQLAKEMQKAGVMDSSISAELKEAQRLLRDAMTPEMQKQLQDLEAQRSKMSGDELQDALAKLQNPQQDMREALEKAKEMLQRAALEGRMESVNDQAKELAKEQKAFADSMRAQRNRSDTAGTGDRANQVKDLSDRTKQMEKDLQTLADRLNKDQANAAKSGVDSAMKQAQESAKQMQEAAKKASEQAGQQGSQQQGQQGQQQQSAGQQGQKAGQNSQQQNAQNGENGQNGQQNKDAAQQAAEAMQKASDQLGQAKESQVNAWKQEITEALDRSIQETQQMARQQEQIGKQASQGASQQLKAQQGALQQGVEQTAERMNQQGQKSALISPNSQRAMDQARKAVEQATRDLNDGATGQQAQRSAQDAADALRQAAASMSRDRERAGSSQTASGLPEMMQEMRAMATQQAQLNAQAVQMLPQAQQLGQGTQQQKEALKPVADKQRELAQKLEDAADADPTKRAEALAREAREISRQLERGELDRNVIDRQSQLFRRMLDAGRTLEQNERDESGKREAKSGEGIRGDAPATGTSRGDPAVKFQEPAWKELTGMSAEDRRLVSEYFRRLNAKKQ